MKTRTLTYDLHPDEPRIPLAGDILAGPRAGYRITEARPVESKVWPNRWRLTAERIGSAQDAYRVCKAAPNASEGGPQWWTFTSYRRGETPADYFGVPR